jgi:DNA-binding NarL/FixJ family response regulator
MRILVADDSDVVRHAIRTLLLKEDGFEVCGEARDGLEALQKARELQPEGVLIDVSMPGLGGFETARRIRQELNDARIVSISQHDPMVLLQGAKDAGADACVDKGFLATELVMTLRKLSAAPSVKS